MSAGFPRYFSRMNALRWLVAVLLTSAPLRAEDAVLRADFSVSTGAIRPLNGINKGPLAPGGIFDVIAEQKELGIPFTRLHDCGWPNPYVVDHHAVFPNPNADPALPESYDPRLTDEYIAAVRKEHLRAAHRAHAAAAAGHLRGRFRRRSIRVETGQAKAESGKLLLQNWSGEASAILTGPTWAAPFTLCCGIDVVGSAPANTAFIRFSHRDDRNTSWLEIRGKGPNAALSLPQTVNGQSQKLAEHKGWSGHALEIAREATGAITVRALDGSKTEILFDKIPAPKPEPGTMGFRTQYQQLSVDKLRVTPP